MNQSSLPDSPRPLPSSPPPNRAKPPDCFFSVLEAFPVRAGAQLAGWMLKGVHAVHAGGGRGVGLVHALHGRVHHERAVGVQFLRGGSRPAAAAARGVEAAIFVGQTQHLAARLAGTEAEELKEALSKPETHKRVYSLFVRSFIHPFICSFVLSFIH